MPQLRPDLQIAWLIPLLPLLGFFVNGFLNNGLMRGKMPTKLSGGFATLMVFCSFCIACYLFTVVSGAAAGAKQMIVPGFPWLTAINDPTGIANLQVNFDLLIDPLSVLMMLIITGVGGLIHLYSTGYMAADKGYSRFFTYLNLFVFFMLLLVMANNMLLLFVGWEGVGLCSYLLIGYFFEKQSAADAAKKAFIVNRIGDVGVLIGMFLLFHYFGTLDFVHQIAPHVGPGILQAAPHLPAIATSALITLTALMLFFGCTGKSAQIPLYTWLPDAMEGPTPVSALIHAATMVTAGVYLVSRTHALFELSDTAMVTVAVTGIATALFAATIGLMQNDIKRVLAYSTVSQLGYMFAACGAGAFAAGMYHVMTHAFFKACLFLGSGSVIHAMEHAMHAHGHSHEEDPAHAEHGDSADTAGGAISGQPDPNDPQDMRNMGGLYRRIPITAVSMIAATLAICGIWPFAGYYSKDEILWKTWITFGSGNWWFWGVGAVTALLTAFYMFRLVMKTFFGAPRTEAARRALDSGPAMLLPVVLLALLSFMACWPILPFLNYDRFSAFLAPSVTTPGYAPAYLGSVNMEQILGWSTLAVIVLVILACIFRYRRAKNGELLTVPQRNDFLPRVIYNKYFVDEAYNHWFVFWGKRFSDWLWLSFERHGVDGLVNGVGETVSGTGRFLRVWQNGYVRSYAFSFVGGIIIVLGIVIGRSLNW